MPRKGSPYGCGLREGEEERSPAQPCHICSEPGSDSVDHVPPLYQHTAHRRAFGLLSAASGSSALQHP